MAAASVLNSSTAKNASDSAIEGPDNDNKNSKSDNLNDKTSEKEEGKLWGYDLYPERRGDKVKATWAQIALGHGKAGIDKIKCERNVYSCLKESHLVRLMVSALKSSGCEVDIRRHISCEICDESVTGGYDPILNQVVVCQNVAKSKGLVQGVLTHEFIHMFDYCRAEMDFKDLKHLACTEIRAANLAHCSFLSAWTQGFASPFNVAKRHSECVKAKAVASVMAVRKIPESEAKEIVDGVFEKCYNDLEPIGRRIRRGSRDMERAYHERYHCGYGD